MNYSGQWATLKRLKALVKMRTFKKTVTSVNTDTVPIIKLGGENTFMWNLRCRKLTHESSIVEAASFWHRFGTAPKNEISFNCCGLHVPIFCSYPLPLSPAPHYNRNVLLHHYPLTCIYTLIPNPNLISLSSSFDATEFKVEGTAFQISSTWSAIQTEGPLHCVLNIDGFPGVPFS